MHILVEIAIGMALLETLGPIHRDNTHRNYIDKNHTHRDYAHRDTHTETTDTETTPTCRLRAGHRTLCTST